MQRKKVYNLNFYFDLHAVSCPGVWLCPKGKVAVRVAIFGVAETTKLLPPTFPLAFNERFHFEKKYRKASNLHQVEKSLGRSTVCLDLFQYPQGKSAPAVKLAEFRACVADIIYPPAGDLDLLFCPKETFPGIIAPKAEVSTRLILTECGGKDSNAPTTILSKGSKLRPIEEPVARQKPVCHTKHNIYCSCFSGKGEQSSIAALAAIRRREIRRTSLEEPRRASPAHKLSHLYHGDILPGSEEVDNCRIDTCTCIRQAGFQNSLHRRNVLSKPPPMSRETEKDGYPHQAHPQPPFRDSRPMKFFKPPSESRESVKDGSSHQAQHQQPFKHSPPRSADVPLETEKPQSAEEIQVHCCLCCPAAPNTHSASKKRYNAEEWSGLEEREEEKEDSHPPLDSTRRIPEQDNAGCEERDIFYSNASKAYIRILRDYFKSGGTKAN